MVGPSWSYSMSYPIGSTNVKLQPRVSSVPVITQSIDANTILWQDTNARPTPVHWLYIAERINSHQTKWNFNIIKTQHNNTQLKLPDLPAGIAPVLISGTQYDVALGGSIEIKDSNNFGIESFRNTGVWRR